MAFNIGLSGVNAAQVDLKTTGNNIANTSTIGFKASRAEFADIYANSKYGTTQVSTGYGVRTAAISQQFTQGGMTFTEKNLDVAINGEGFFNVERSNGETAYTRNGQFQIDKNGYIVTNSADKLLGFDENGSPIPLEISSEQIDPLITSEITLSANLDAASNIIDSAIEFDRDDPDSYNNTTALTTYDSFGNAMLTSIYFRKNEPTLVDGDPDSANWSVYTRTTDSQGNAMNNGPFEVAFSPTGALSSIDEDSLATKFSIELAHDLTAASLQPIEIDISKLSQYGADFAVNDLNQDGYTTGSLSGVEIGQDGNVQTRYTNGESKIVGQIILTTFNNPQGLSEIGGNKWLKSGESGDPTNNIPGGSNVGVLQAGALEQANVDLTKELINLIISQRNFQANAKTLTTADTVTQAAIQL
ncbi:MAG: flagellar hook protein FlgE [Gammaproteobacteria bacterium]|nr:flagellar hook protein FlgE [Gammaproteobacteria bacterium]